MPTKTGLMPVDDKTISLNVVDTERKREKWDSSTIDSDAVGRIIITMTLDLPGRRITMQILPNPCDEWERMTSDAKTDRTDRIIAVNVPSGDLCWSSRLLEEFEACCCLVGISSCTICVKRFERDGIESVSRLVNQSIQQDAISPLTHTFFPTLTTAFPNLLSFFLR